MKKDYSLAGRSLLKYRRHLWFRINLVTVLLFILFEGIVTLCAMHAFNFFKDSNLPSFIPESNAFKLFENDTYNVLFYVGIGLLLLALIIIIRILQYKHLNKKYQKRYIETLFNETELHDLNMFPKKSATINEFEKDEAKMMGYASLNYLNSYSAVSTDVVIELTQVKYNKRKSGYGVLVSTYLDKTINGFMQLRKIGEPGIKSYREKDVLCFGSSHANFVRNCSVYSTLERETYAMLDAGLEGSIFNFAKFANSNWIITFYDNRLIFMLEGWRFRLMRPLKWKPLPSELETQVEGLKRIYREISALIEIAKQWETRR